MLMTWLLITLLGCLQSETEFACTCDYTLTSAEGEESTDELDASSLATLEEAQGFIDETCPDLCEARELGEGESFDCEAACDEVDVEE